MNDTNISEWADIPKKNLNKQNLPADHTSFNTLAQLSLFANSGEKSPFFLSQNDADILKKRANSKCITNGILDALISLDSPFQKKYINAKNCASVIQLSNGKLTSKYCNQRFCLVCNRIRTAKLINGYKSQLENINEKYFVTLTIPNCRGFYLKKNIEVMNKSFREIYKQMKNKNRYLRGSDKFQISGIKKLECTYNERNNDFHPHFHFIISTEKTANFLVEEWLKKFPNANFAGQKIIKCYNDGYIEIFKYFTKFWSKGEKKHSLKYYNDLYLGRKNGIGNVFIPALDVIFQAMERKRVFEPLGIKKIDEKITNLDADIFIDTEKSIENQYFFNEIDWFDEFNNPLCSNDTTQFVQEMLQKIVL